jgi:hypothetical protein
MQGRDGDALATDVLTAILLRLGGRRNKYNECEEYRRTGGLQT